MLYRSFKSLIIFYNSPKMCPIITKYPLRNFRLSSVKLENDNKEKSKELLVYGSFEDIQDKTKNTYLEMLKIFVNRDHIYRRGHVEFIYAALKNMEGFGVSKDLEVYKALIDVLPKGKFVPANLIQSEFMHYPKQQQCVVDVLEQMEDNGVMPDYEMQDLLVNIFGTRAIPVRKFWRMMYWMPKFKNLSPWPLPNPLPDSVFELAKLAIERISSVDLKSEVKVYDSKYIEDSIDDTWIISAQSPIQKRLLNDHDKEKPVYVEGAFRIWIKDRPVNYFVLRAEPKPFKRIDEDLDDVSNLKIPFFTFHRPPLLKVVRDEPTIHEQEDGVIFAVCATGTSSKDSLLSWIRHLEKDNNSVLSKLSVVFRLKSGTKEIATVEDIEPKLIEHK